MFVEDKRNKARCSFILMLAVVLILSAAVLTDARTRRRHTVRRTLWEYNVVTIVHANTEQRKSILNEQGRSGWELISSEDDKSGTGETTFYFKRLHHRRR